MVSHWVPFTGGAWRYECGQEDWRRIVGRLGVDNKKSQKLNNKATYSGVCGSQEKDVLVRKRIETIQEEILLSLVENTECCNYRLCKYRNCFDPFIKKSV